MAAGFVDLTAVDLGQRVVGERLLHLEVVVTHSAFVLIDRHDANLQLLEARGLAVNSEQRPDPVALVMMTVVARLAPAGRTGFRLDLLG